MIRARCWLLILALFLTLSAIGVLHRNRLNESHLDGLAMQLRKCSERTTFLKHKGIYKQDGNFSSRNHNVPEVFDNKEQVVETGDGKLHSQINELPEIRLLTPYTFMPHLMDNQKALVPALLKTRNRMNATMVLGIPTTASKNVFCLKATINNLINNMDEAERNETLIVIFIGEMEWPIVNDIFTEIESAFALYMATGLIDVVAPDPTYYPDFQSLCLTLPKEEECKPWRTKQSLDIMYLMAFVQNRGSYYVQLDDDISVEPNFISTMEKFANLANVHEPSWAFLHFCEHDIIGKTFKSSDLPNVIIFIEMFYNNNAFKWILNKYVEVKVCDFDIYTDCTALKNVYCWPYYPSLFYKNKISN